MRTKFKAWAEPYLEEHKEISLSLDELSNLTSFYLEIGSGKGQFIVDMALSYPILTFIGLEKNVTCAGISAKKLVENNVTNAKIIYIDALKALPYIKNESVEILFLNFSDPWPKTRHFKRRLTSINFLNEYFRILKNNGKIIMKTDNENLYNFSKKIITESNLFSIENDCSNYLGDDSFDKQTEYELSFREKGQNIFRLKLVKNLKKT